MKPFAFVKLPVVMYAIEVESTRVTAAELLKAFASKERFTTGFDIGVRPVFDPCTNRWSDRECEVWVAKSNAWCKVRVGDILVIEPDGSGVYPIQRAIFERTCARQVEADEAH